MSLVGLEVESKRAAFKLGSVCVVGQSRRGGGARVLFNCARARGNAQKTLQTMVSLSTYTQLGLLVHVRSSTHMAVEILSEMGKMLEVKCCD